MKSKYILLILISLFIISCDLEQIPVDSTTRQAVFNSVNGLELYSTSFYNFLPSANNIHTADNMSDYAARRDVPPFIREGVYGPNVVDNTSASAYNLVALGADWNWGWGTLRNINYFLVNNNSPAVSNELKQHYAGLARFFRAFFYFEKVKRYGDVPWINVPLDVSDPKLYAPRDPRTLVMDSVLADINYACQYIRTIDDPSRTLITKNVAYALKARICLFEGTFRKYHTNLGLASSANTWLNEAATAAKVIMDSGKFSVYEGLGSDRSYRALFNSEAPVAAEIMLSVVSSTTLSVVHAANWYLTSATTGVRFNFIRPFIHTYLNIDGTPFTSKPGYQTMVLKDEVKNRDKRLAQTIRTPGFTRVSGGSTITPAPEFTYSYTGYQPIKWTVDNVALDQGNLNTNAVSIFRYGEVLLNYAEAKAELGTLTDDDWTKTVGALRKRAGITGGLTTKPTVVDPYLQSVYFPNITDPVILEVRRDRGIELAMEGFRFYDVVRWRRGELMEMPWRGMYVPASDQLMDVNDDGKNDTYFMIVNVPSAQRVSGVTYVNVAAMVGTAVNPQLLSNVNSGEITWLANIARKWAPKNYLYPIPESAILSNPNLGQNPGWN